MRSIAETIAAADLWVELTHEKRAGFASDFLSATAAAGKQHLINPLLSRVNQLRNVEDVMSVKDHRYRLATAASGALVSGGAAAKGTWEAAKTQPGGLTRQQLDAALQEQAAESHAKNEGREKPVSTKALDRAKAVAAWAAENPRAAAAISGTGGALAGGLMSAPWYRQHLLRHVKP